MIWQYVSQQILKISSVSTFDYINITGHYLTLLSGKREKVEILNERQYPQHMIDAAMKGMKHPEVTVAGLNFKVPLTQFKYPLMSYVLVLLENYERGLLPFAGTISEQPSQIVEILNLIQLLKIEHQNQLEKKSNV